MGGVWERNECTSTEFHHPFTHNQRVTHISVKETVAAIYSLTIVERRCPSPLTFLLKTESTVIRSFVNKGSRMAKLNRLERKVMA